MTMPAGYPRAACYSPTIMGFRLIAEIEFDQPLLSDDDGKTWFPSRFRVCLNVEGREDWAG